jgi:methylated-DNA-[protein]-cysteine S-methyltransferase
VEVIGEAESVIRFIRIDSPLGELLLSSEDAALTGVHFIDQKHPARLDERWTEAPGDALLMKAARQLEEYFAGGRRRFDLPLAPRGTPFQRRVWDALLAIDFGLTASYRDISVRVGSPSATRAIGAAVGRNPIGIIIPCHRVIGADGSLTGYAGGLDRKRHLLALEAEPFVLRGASSDT